MSYLLLARYPIIGAIAGATVMAATIYFGIALNYKGLRSSFAGFRQDARFYRAWAFFGGAVGGAWGVAMPAMDAYGVKYPWYGLVMIAIGVVFFIPLVRFIKRHRLIG